MSTRIIGPLTLHVGDCLQVMRKLDESSVDAIVTDPPYGLGFMGKAWDDLPPGREWAEECLRVLKPGGHLLAFGGSRTWHRLAVAVEDAGFEIRDSISWLYGSGFPKSLDVSKAIDKAAGAEREVIGRHTSPAGNKPGGASLNMSLVGMPATADITAPATDDAKTWAGWGTALKPAFEPIVVGRKPLVGTVAANVLAHGTGALNIDACRVGSGVGRWPANVVLDDSQAAELDKQSGTLTSGANPKRRGADGNRTAYGEFAGQEEAFAPRGVDSGGASRFFPIFSPDWQGDPCLMCDGTGLDRIPGWRCRACNGHGRDASDMPTFRYQAKAPTRERPKVDGVAHPTVKPLELMRWLVRLVTPPGGTVLEPFAGSGTTVEACLLESVFVVAIEREPTYVPLVLHRVERVAGLPEGWLS